MGILQRVFGRRAKELTYDQVAALLDSGGSAMVGGLVVTAQTAIQVTTVLACVKTIADGCATPDLHVFREKADGTREKATNIPEYRLLSRRPNEWQTSYEWRRMMTLHAALTGTAISLMVRGDNGRVRELIPILPGRWSVLKTNRYTLEYRCWDEFGMIGVFDPADLFILQGVQWDWAYSLDAVKLAASAIGLSMATERSQAQFQANGMRPSGLYSVDGNLTDAQHTRLTAWLKKRSGPNATGEPLILDRAAKWVSSTMTGVDSQHVETRRLQIEEICRAYGVFPIMIGHSDKTATFASSEAFFAAHVKHTLAPWHKAWTQRIDETIVAGEGPLFAEFDTRYLTAGSMKDRAVWAAAMVQNRIYTPNQIREMDGEDPIPGGNEFPDTPTPNVGKTNANPA
jgi:HK97 family phage portal protein